MIDASRFPDIESAASTKLMGFFSTPRKTLGLMVIQLHLKNQHEVCHEKLVISEGGMVYLGAFCHGSDGGPW
jgi:hypothetical protein